MTDLDQLESQSVYILREAFNKIDRLALLWSIGKDSNVLLWLVRKAFFGKVPFPVVQLDTAMELPEVYEFRDVTARDWDLDLVIEQCPPESEMDPTLPPATRAAARKTEGLKALLKREQYQGIFVGIRRDEQATRAKERVFSPRALDGVWDFKDQPAEFWDHYKTRFEEGTHVRIHPLLHWTELDI
jgi:sulfate adenylyltransferase subunit 2